MLAAGCRRLQAGVWRPYLRARRHRWTQFNGGFYTSRPLCLERQNLFAATSVHYYSALSLSLSTPGARFSKQITNKLQISLRPDSPEGKFGKDPA